MNKDKIYQIISDVLGVDKAEITSESNLYEDFNCSQLEINDLMMKIAESIDLEMNDFDVHNVNTVADILDYCETNSYEE